MATYDGIARLGEYIGGGGQSTSSNAYLQGLTGGYKAQSAMHDADKSREEARIMRARAIARDSLPDALETAGYQENMRPLLAAVLGSNQTMDLDQLGKYAVVEAAPAFAAAAQAVGSGDIAEYNDQMALASGRERKPYTLDAGGRAVFRGDTGEVEFTPLGDAAVESEAALELARQAHARASDASAGASRSLGSLRDRTDPNRPRTGAGKTENPTSESAVLAQARDAIARGADKKAVIERLRARGYSNLAERL